MANQDTEQFYSQLFHLAMEDDSSFLDGIMDELIKMKNIPESFVERYHENIDWVRAIEEWPESEHILNIGAKYIPYSDWETATKDSLYASLVNKFKLFPSWKTMAENLELMPGGAKNNFMIEFVLFLSNKKPLINNNVNPFAFGNNFPSARGATNVCYPSPKVGENNNPFKTNAAPQFKFGASNNMFPPTHNTMNVAYSSFKFGERNYMPPRTNATDASTQFKFGKRK